MRKIIFYVAITIYLSACSTYWGPKENTSFAEITSTEQLVGLYQNKGDPYGYLSNVLRGLVQIDPTGKKEAIPHDKISFIQVTTLNNKIVVNAIKNDCIYISREYTPGRDFKISNGRISFRKDFNAFSEGHGDVILGPSVTDVELGLDLKGNGKYHETHTKAGLAFMVVPVTGTDVRDITFLRHSTTNNYAPCTDR